MTTHITPERIAELLALGGYTPGPWFATNDRADWGLGGAWRIMPSGVKSHDFDKTICTLQYRQPYNLPDDAECDEERLAARNASVLGAAPDLHAALAQVNAENQRLRYLIREGCDLLAVESDALREGILIGGQMPLDPEDKYTVIEDWIARAGRAALNPEGEA